MGKIRVFKKTFLWFHAEQLQAGMKERKNKIPPHPKCDKDRGLREQKPDFGQQNKGKRKLGFSDGKVSEDPAMKSCLLRIHFQVKVHKVCEEGNKDGESEEKRPVCIWEQEGQKSRRR